MVYLPVVFLLLSQWSFMIVSPAASIIQACALDVFYLIDVSIASVAYQNEMLNVISNSTRDYVMSNNGYALRASVCSVGGIRENSFCLTNITSPQSHDNLVSAVQQVFNYTKGNGQFLNTTISNISNYYLDLLPNNTVSIYLTANVNLSDTNGYVDITNMFGKANTSIGVMTLGFGIDFQTLQELHSTETFPISSPNAIPTAISSVMDFYELYAACGRTPPPPNLPTTTISSTAYLSTSASSTSIPSTTTVTSTTSFTMSNFTTTEGSETTNNLWNTTTTISTTEISARNATSSSTTDPTTQATMTTEKYQTSTNYPEYEPLPYTPQLKNITDQPFDASNVTIILNETLPYTGINMLSGDLELMADVLTKAANLQNTTSDVVVGILQNVNGIMSAKNGVFELDQLSQRNSSERILSSLISSVKSSNSSHLDYLEADLLGYTVRKQNDGAVGMLDHDSKFSAVSSEPKRGNAIIIPADVVKANAGSRVVTTVFRNDKLFVASRPILKVDKHGTPVWLPPYHEQSSQAVSLVELPTPIIPKPFGNCTLQRYLTSNVPVLSSTIISYDPVVKPQSNIMANLYFDMSSLSAPLHGKYSVTWWNYSSLEWASDGECKIKMKNGRIFATCNHLTDFTVVVDGVPNDPIICNKSLNIVGYIVNSISLVCLMIYFILILIVRFTGFRYDLKVETDESEGQSKFYKFRENLLFAMYSDPVIMIIRDMLVLSLMIFFFLFTFFNDQNLVGGACHILGAISYTCLIWALELNGIFAIALILLKNNLDLRTLNRNVARILWILVAVFLVCSAIASILLLSFTTFFYRGDRVCWVRPDLIWEGMIIPILFMAVTVIICIVCLVYRKFTVVKKANSESQLHSLVDVVIISLALGLPWLLDFFTLGWPHATFWHYSFTIFNGSQGTITFTLLLWKLRNIWKYAIQEKHRSQKLRTNKRQSADRIRQPTTIEGIEFTDTVVPREDDFAVIVHADDESTESGSPFERYGHDGSNGSIEFGVVSPQYDFPESQTPPRKPPRTLSNPIEFNTDLYDFPVSDDINRNERSNADIPQYDFPLIDFDDEAEIVMHPPSDNNSDGDGSVVLRSELPPIPAARTTSLIPTQNLLELDDYLDSQDQLINQDLQSPNINLMDRYDFVPVAEENEQEQESTAENDNEVQHNILDEFDTPFFTSDSPATDTQKEDLSPEHYDFVHDEDLNVETIEPSDLDHLPRLSNSEMDLFFTQSPLTELTPLPGPNDDLIDFIQPSENHVEEKILLNSPSISVGDDVMSTPRSISESELYEDGEHHGQYDHLPHWHYTRINGLTIYDRTRHLDPDGNPIEGSTESESPANETHPSPAPRRFTINSNGHQMPSTNLYRSTSLSGMSRKLSIRRLSS